MGIRGGGDVEDGRPDDDRLRLVRGALFVALAGAVVGLAVAFHWLGWSSIPGGSCGSAYSPCPEGTTPTLILAFVLTFTGLPLAVAMVAALKRVRPGRTLPMVLLALGALSAAWPGKQFYLWLRGPVLDVAWDTPVDRPNTVAGVGNWVLDGAVVRVRTDGLIAYDPRDGAGRWTLDAPVRASVCAMSDTVSQGVAVIGFGRHEAPCDTVWGVDVDSGRKLWERKIDAGDRTGSTADGRLAADGATAVALESTSVRGLALREGTPKWRTPMGKECSPRLASSSDGVTRVLVECVKDYAFQSVDLVTLDSATGAVKSRKKLPVESEIAGARVISAEPFTLWLKEADERGVNAVTSYDAQGAERTSLRLTRPDEDLVVGDDTDAFAVRPALLTAVVGDTLVATTRKPGAAEATMVAGYSLSDGRRLWHTTMGSRVNALTVLGAEKAAVFTEQQRVVTIDVRTGSKDDGVPVREAGDRISDRPQLVRTPDGWIFVNAVGTGGVPPAIAVRR
ncbi:PQQ-binding-like beta-propeller repeat protein [Streptomyces sp. NPDC051907]|uniref:outer membrane protein assembly factor BamB family protein n=1 Tax=Streptomyces sp. NPDC051907 TaxID=3155284 RepID=UPI00341F58D0